MGQPLDEYNLNWGMQTIKSFFDKTESREANRTTTFPDGGYPYRERGFSKAEKELETAVKDFKQLPRDAKKEQILPILMSIFRAVEVWIDEKLKSTVSTPEIQTLGLNRKIEILSKKRIIKDPVLLEELSQIRNLRNATMHYDETPISLDGLYRYLQMAMHFIKLEAPSSYSRTQMQPRFRTLQGASVRSKSEVIIANVLTGLGIDFKYEEPLFSKTDPHVRRIPDFTITARGQRFYWEHVSMSDDPEYRRLWERKRKWYEKNGYLPNLIVTRESPTRAIDSQKIAELAKKRILDLKESDMGRAEHRRSMR